MEAKGPSSTTHYLCGQATEEMHRRLRITDDYSQKLSIRRKVKEENIYWQTSLEEWETVARRRFECRSAFLKLLTVDTDSTTSLVSLPLKNRVNRNSSGFGAQVNLESLRLFYTKPPNPLTFIRPNVPLGSRIIGVYCRKPFANEVSTVSSQKQHSQNKEVVNEATKWSELSCENGSSYKSFSDYFNGSEMVDNVRRRPTKKRRKKRKKGKKLSGASSSTKPYLLSLEHADGSSASETCGNIGRSEHCGPVSLSISEEASLPECGINNDSPILWKTHHGEVEEDMPSPDGQGENAAEKYEQSSCSFEGAYISCQSFSNDDSDTDDDRERLSPPMYLPHLLSKAGVQAQEETLLAKSSSRSSSSTALNHNSAHVHSDEEADKSLTPIDTVNGITQNISSVEVAVCVHSDEEADKSWSPTDSGEGTAQNISSGEIAVRRNSDNKSGTHTHAAEGITQNISSREVAVCTSQATGDLNAGEAESYRILKAVENASRAKLASEAFQRENGGPIAELEKILHHSSPVVKYPNLITCQTCSRNQTPGLVVCEHVTTHIALGCLWKWYKRNGSYGLEIRTEEFRKSKGLIAFDAYYVPYLSGVQLFRNFRSDSACNSTTAPANDSILSSDLELLFEYFESEKPQHRQPLYNQIEELIRGNEPVSNIYGDPTILKTIKLNEIHPASWYAVAWYPIYRIPEGNLHAAFLTYHTLGHLVIQSAGFENPGADARIVSPVVGLQSCNAQDECWFQVKHYGPMQTTKTPMTGVNSSREVFKVRLRTLEETASLMA